MIMSENIKRILIYITGVFMISLGIIIFLECRLGSDPITVILDGLSNTFKVRYSTSSLMYNTTLLITCFIFSRKHIGAGTIFYLLAISFFINLSENLLAFMNITDMSIYSKIPLLIVGQIILSAGMSLVVVANIGKNSLDGIIFKIEELTKQNYMTIRTTIDIMYTIIGFLLGGVVGLGTVFSALTTGWMMKNFINIFNKSFNLIESN